VGKRMRRTTPKERRKKERNKYGISSVFWKLSSEREMERIRRLFVVLVWLAYGVTAFRLFGNFLDHPRRDENASLISFCLIILLVTILAAFLHKGVNWIMMKGKKPQKG
jgi:hypothetical protein